MIKMGEIACRIPSNGIKPEILYCTEPEGMRLDIWAVSSNIATALLTLLLLLAALGALRTAKNTLGQMQIDSEAQWETVRVQLNKQAQLAEEAQIASRQLARDQQQAQLLIEYLTAMHAMQLGSSNSSDDSYDMVKGWLEASLRWAAWSMYLHGEHDDFRKLTKKYSDVFGDICNFLYSYSRGEERAKPHNEVVKLLNAMANSFHKHLHHLTAWQAADQERPAYEKLVARNLAVLEIEFASIRSQGAPA